MADSQKYSGAIGAATLHPLERVIAATIHERRDRARKEGRATTPLDDARAAIHALARYMTRGGAPVEMNDSYAVALAGATLGAPAWSKFRDYQRAGVGPHEALHAALNDVRECFPAEAAPAPDLRADDLSAASAPQAVKP